MGRIQSYRNIVSMGIIEELTALEPMMTNTSLLFGSALLVAAGIYQLTPLKHTCLRHCRSPIDFLGHTVAKWNKGRSDHGSGTRSILPWMLLGLNGTVVLRWHHEFIGSLGLLFSSYWKKVSPRVTGLDASVASF